MKIIQTAGEMRALKRELGVRPDWHEPDEQGVTAIVVGATLDNAGIPNEKQVVIRQNGEDVAAVNLATLLAFASGYDGHTEFYGAGAPHGCGLCDGPLLYAYTDGSGYKWYNCAFPECGNGHISKDCCE